MVLETKLHQKLTQKLVMTPQLRQAIKILQVPRIELETIIEQTLAENPVLEELGEDKEEEAQEGDGQDFAGEKEQAVGELDHIDWKEYLETYTNDFHALSDKEIEVDEEKRSGLENLSVRGLSLAEHLAWQLRLDRLSPEEEGVAALIIGNLDEDGYLRVGVDEVAFLAGVEQEVVERVLQKVQECEPAGVGARDLRECLLLQLRAVGLENSLAAVIVSHHLPLLESRRFDRLAKELGVPADEVTEAIKTIMTLDPKPGRDFGEGDVRYVTPDVYINKVGDEYVVTLNDEGLPRLRVSSYYRRVLSQESTPEARQYIQEKMRAAAWLIKSIHQRQRTLYLVTQSIVRFQRDFLEKGVMHMRPLVLKDVAKDIGMHESTVSRATASKYVHAPQGIFPLKYFFTTSLKSQQGEEVSAESVKERIREIIRSEDSRRPISDQYIAQVLARDNVSIARRTVAKYREVMGILPSSRRKQK